LAVQNVCLDVVLFVVVVAHFAIRGLLVMGERISPDAAMAKTNCNDVTSHSAACARATHGRTQTNKTTTMIPISTPASGLRMSFAFALDQLRFAIAARRTAILDHSGNAPEATAPPAAMMQTAFHGQLNRQ
jgi:hypothetical protein